MSRIQTVFNVIPSILIIGSRYIHIYLYRFCTTYIFRLTSYDVILYYVKILYFIVKITSTCVHDFYVFVLDLPLCSLRPIINGNHSFSLSSTLTSPVSPYLKEE